MRKSPFIWLGSGRSRKQKVARKARLLDQAASFGLPVPAGGILLEEFYQICLSEGLVELNEGVLIIPDPDWLAEVLYHGVRFPHLDKLVAVRSGSGADTADQPMTTARLNVDFHDPHEMANALREVWSANRAIPEIQSHEILVMEMVSAQVEGAAFSTTESLEDHVTFFNTPERGQYTNIPMEKIGFLQRTSSEMPPFARRLQKLMRGVRRSIGKGEWRIEWADDGEICWLLQIKRGT